MGALAPSSHGSSVAESLLRSSAARTAAVTNGQPGGSAPAAPSAEAPATGPPAIEDGSVGGEAQATQVEPAKTLSAEEITQRVADARAKLADDRKAMSAPRFVKMR